MQSRRKDTLNTKTLNLLLVATSVLALLAGAESASATPMTMTLTDGVSTITVIDELLNDSYPGLGAVSFIGSIGNFYVTVSTGLSKPVLSNTPTFAEMDLNVLAVSSGSGGTLTINLVDDGFLATGPGTLTAILGGTTDGTVTAGAHKNSGVAAVSLGPFFATTFSDSQSATHGALGPYSMTLTATITHDSGSSVSTGFDLDVQNVPEPSSLALLGLGLFVLGLGARRHFRVAKLPPGTN